MKSNSTAIRTANTQRWGDVTMALPAGCILVLHQRTGDRRIRLIQPIKQSLGHCSCMLLPNLRSTTLIIEPPLSVPHMTVLIWPSISNSLCRNAAMQISIEIARHSRLLGGDAAEAVTAWLEKLNGSDNMCLGHNYCKVSSETNTAHAILLS